MKKKIVIICMTLLTVGLLFTPVLAKGPEKAEIKNDNPNMEIIYF
jgi:hypothetical protein